MESDARYEGDIGQVNEILLSRLGKGVCFGTWLGEKWHWADG